MSKLLPVGSVVRLKKDELAILMIAGYYPVQPDSQTKYEYIGLNYPDGLAENLGVLMFQNADIETVLFEGYSTEESRKSLDDLQEKAEKLF